MINVVVLFPSTSEFLFLPLPALCGERVMDARMVVPSLFESYPLQTTRSNSHELIQYHKFEPELQGVAKSLYRMADANTVKVK